MLSDAKQQLWPQAATEMHYTATNKLPCDEPIHPEVQPLLKTLKNANHTRKIFPLSGRHQERDTCIYPHWRNYAESTLSAF